MSTNTTFTIASVPGDGIGIELVDSAGKILTAAQSKVGGFSLHDNDLQAGAGYYQECGKNMTQDAFGAADNAVSEGFASNHTRPMELGGNQGNREVSDTLLAIAEQLEAPELADVAP